MSSGAATERTVATHLPPCTGSTNYQHRCIYVLLRITAHLVLSLAHSHLTQATVTHPQAITHLHPLRTVAITGVGVDAGAFLLLRFLARTRPGREPADTDMVQSPSTQVGLGLRMPLTNK
jgi:hypothetical protein